MLTLQDFQQGTNRGFAQWFFSSWLRLGNKRTISCPACNTKMIQLIVEGKNKIELDCCPACFALWLDSGEDLLLHKLFQKHMGTEKIRDLSSEQHQVLANILLEHDHKIQRYKFFARLGRFLNVRLRVRGVFMREPRAYLLHMLFDDDNDSKN